METLTDSASKSRWIKGAALAWAPVILFMVPMFASVLRGMSTQKATGLGAVAGGISEGLVTFGLVSLVATQLVAIVLLVRSFHKGHTLRNLFSVVTIFGSVMLLALVFLSMWMLIRF